MRSYSVVENRGFISMVTICGPKYPMSSRPYFSVSLVQKRYEEYKEVVFNSRSKATFVDITTDDWISRATVSYITITVNYIPKSTYTSFQKCIYLFK